MTETAVTPQAQISKDRILQIFKWTAFGAMGLYMWRKNKVEEKALGRANPNGFQVSINAEKAIGAAFDVIPPLQRLNPIVKMGVMEFVKGFQKGK